MQLPSPLGQNPGNLPSPVGPLSGLAGLGGSGSSSTVLAVDVTNSNSAAFQACGFNIPVVAGVPVAIEFIMQLDPGANVGGCNFRISHPGSTNGSLDQQMNTTLASNFIHTVVALGASPFNCFGGAAEGAFAGVSGIQMYLVFTPSGSGNVDVLFAPGTNTQLMTIRAGSVARKV